METFQLSILAPERRLTENEAVSSLILTTAEGEIEILSGHVDMVSKLETGRFVYKAKEGKIVSGVISSGFVNVQDGTVKVIAETIELPNEIDRARAKQAQLNAEKKLQDASLGVHEFKKYQLKLHRAIIRQTIDENGNIYH
ncbi:MAG: ATP synthase F1 subunit epsilon [Bdellovibrionales bacterium]|nr:ATP synthase F1 subunit epsilon [Bdellovibrionales bacterium]